ncbi:MAG: DUF551 domain-containing protein [Selenomonadaceae bacterium]|nr:DUF551 domain-containing protein [Selenomonadaceae bacterium]
MRPIDADALKQDLTRFYDNEVKAKELIDEQPTVSGWVSIKDGPPESGKHVFVTCEIRSLHGYKMQYVCEAFYAAEHSISEGKYPDDTDCYDYSEEDDEYYLKEGWYEVIHNWDEYSSIVIGDFVTHWMPLPEPPEVNKNANGD